MIARRSGHHIPLEEPDVVGTAVSGSNGGASKGMKLAAERRLSARRVLIRDNGGVFNGEVKLVRKATGYVKKPMPHYPAAGSRLREPSFPAPFDRISAPQIPLTRRNREPQDNPEPPLERLSQQKRLTRQADLSNSGQSEEPR